MRTDFKVHSVAIGKHLCICTDLYVILLCMIMQNDPMCDFINEVNESALLCRDHNKVIVDPVPLFARHG